MRDRRKIQAKEGMPERFVDEGNPLVTHILIFAQGMSPMMHGIFPRGGIELVEHVQDKFHIEWVKELEEKSTQEQVRDPQTNPSAKSLGHLTSLSFYPP
jgi:hypothetical protein